MGAVDDYRYGRQPERVDYTVLGTFLSVKGWLCLDHDALILLKPKVYEHGLTVSRTTWTAVPFGLGHRSYQASEPSSCRGIRSAPHMDRTRPRFRSRDFFFLVISGL